MNPIEKEIAQFCRDLYQCWKSRKVFDWEGARDLAELIERHRPRAVPTDGPNLDPTRPGVLAWVGGKPIPTRSEILAALVSDFLMGKTPKWEPTSENEYRASYKRIHQEIARCNKKLKPMGKVLPFVLRSHPWVKGALTLHPIEDS